MRNSPVANRIDNTPCKELLNQLPVAVCVVGADLVVRSCNARWLEFLGREPETYAEGRALASVLPADLSAELVRLAERAKATGTRATLRGISRRELVWDLDIVAAEGGALLVAVDVSERAQEAADAQQFAQLAAERLTVSALEAQDARDREAAARAEAELRQERLDAFLTSMPEAVVAYNSDGRVEAANRACLSFFRADPIGLDFAEIISRLDIRRMDGTPVSAKDLPGARALHGEVVVRERMRARRQDGERTVLASAAPVRNRGQIRGAVVVVIDVTDPDRAEVALRRSEERFRAVLENSMDAAYRRDLGSDRYDYLSPVVESITGYSAGELMSMGAEKVFALIHPDDRSTVDRGLGRLGADTGGVVLHYRFRCKDGTFRWLADAVVLHPARDGGPAFLAGNLRDITDAKRAENAVRQANAQLVEADRRKNDFLATLSHELRNPLAPIRNSVFITRRATPGGEQAMRALAIIDRQVTYMARLIDDLLDVTRISRGKIRLQRELADLNEIVRGTGEDLRQSFRGNGISFRIALPEHPIRARIDRTRIAQMIGNLLQNAVKFTPTGGQVTLSLSLDPARQAVIEVRDTGAGMEPQLIERLFEPFVQGAQTIDRSRGGLGLGLALVKGLAELHGGTTSATSEGPGKGSTFTIRLPVEAEVEERAPGQEGMIEPNRALRVLVIEDNQDAATTLKDVLELGGHGVDVASTGPQGIEKAREETPDLIICDIGLPELDGYGVARAVRSDPRLRDTYLVALSGYALQEDVEKSNQAGFDRHLAKPPDMSVLQAVVAEAAGHGARARHHAS